MRPRGHRSGRGCVSEGRKFFRLRGSAGTTERVASGPDLGGGRVEGRGFSGEEPEQRQGGAEAQASLSELLLGSGGGAALGMGGGRALQASAGVRTEGVGAPPLPAGLGVGPPQASNIAPRE